MERINGYRNIGEYKKLNRQIACSLFAKSWYSDGENEYLFKVVSNYKAYKELFYSYFMRKINFRTVEIDLAVLGSQFGVIAKNYNPNQFPIYSVEQILNKFWDEKIRRINKEQKYYLASTISYEHDYNLERLPGIIDLFLLDNKNIQSPHMQEESLLQFIAQIIGGSIDLHARNLEIVIEKTAKFSPLYDFGEYGEINIKGKKSYPYRFQYKTTKEGEIIKPKETLKQFLDNATKKEIELLNEYLEKAREEAAKTIYIEEEIEDQIGKHVSKDMAKYVRKKLKKNLTNIYELCNKKE